MAVYVETASGRANLLSWLPNLAGRINAGLRAKLTCAFFVPLLMMALICYVGIAALKQSHDRLEIASQLQEKLVLFEAIEQLSEEVRFNAADFLFSRAIGASSNQTSPLGNFSNNGLYNAAEFSRQITRNTSLSEQERDILMGAVVDLRAVLRAGIEIYAKRNNGDADAAHAIYRTALKEAAFAIKSASYNWQQVWRRELAGVLAENQIAFEQSRSLILAASAIAALIAGVLGLTISTSIIRPVHALQGAFDRLSAGDFATRLKIENRDELGELCADMNETIQRLGDAYAELETANQHKSDFLANMSHELRTPMNAIIGFTRIVMRKSRDVLPEKQLGNLEKVASSAEMLLSLINGILDLSKIEAGRLDVHAETFDAAPVLKSCARMIDPMLEGKPVEVGTDIPDSLPVASSDQGMLRQITLNLLSNAAKFTEAGQISIAAEVKNGQIRVSVRDTGIGMRPDDLNMVFDEFTQAEQHTARRYGGTGLGLAISRKMARLLGGDLVAESTFGEGSTFVLTVPEIYAAAEREAV